MRIAIALAVAAAAAMAAQSPAFDVNSVKRAPQNVGRGITVQPGGRFMAPSATVRDLVAAAYDIQDNQITGGPGWIGSDRFEVTATTRADVTMADARALLRALLTERFKFAARREQRELAVYTLELARADRTPGPQLRPSPTECESPKGPGPDVRKSFPAFAPAPPPPPAPAAGGRILALDSPPLPCPSMAFDNPTVRHWSLRAWPVARFAQRLSAALGRPVIDRTGLEGPFDIDLSFAVQAPGVDVQSDVPTLTTALREQLGLRLDSTRAPVDVLVIDRVEPPTEN